MIIKHGRQHDVRKGLWACFLDCAIRMLIGWAGKLRSYGGDLALLFVCTERSICLSNPCLNGGTCLDEMYGYRCSCNLGYRGKNCQRKCHIDSFEFEVNLSNHNYSLLSFLFQQITCVNPTPAIMTEGV